MSKKKQGPESSILSMAGLIFGIPIGVILATVASTIIGEILGGLNGMECLALSFPVAMALPITSPLLTNKKVERMIQNSRLFAYSLIALTLMWMIIGGTMMVITMGKLMPYVVG